MQAGQVGHVQRQQRAGDELGGAAAAAGVGRAFVAGLDEGDRVVVEQWRQQVGDPVGLEARHVAVAPHDEVAGAGGERGPQRVALAVTDAVAVVDVADRHDRRPGALGDDGGVVGAAVVEHDQLVDDAVRGRRASARIVRTSEPIVATSSRHGMHIDTVRPRLRRGDALGGAVVDLEGPITTTRRQYGRQRCSCTASSTPARTRSTPTPSSTAPEAALARARRLLADGADAIDLGGQGSTDIAAVVDWHEEWARLEAIVPALAGLGVDVSIDSWRPEVVRRALRRRRHRDQRRRRHAVRRDVARRRRLRRADRRAVPVRPEPTRDGARATRSGRGDRRVLRRPPRRRRPLRPAPPLHRRPRHRLRPAGVAVGGALPRTRSGSTPTSTRCAASICRCTSPCRGRRPRSTTSCWRSSSASSPSSAGRTTPPRSASSSDEPPTASAAGRAGARRPAGACRPSPAGSAPAPPRRAGRGRSGARRSAGAGSSAPASRSATSS